MLTLAIGILGNTTIFSGVNALLFTPLPAERPEQIAQILPAIRSASRFGGRSSKHPLKLYMALRDHNTSFVALAAIRDVTVPISDTAQSARTEQYTGVVRGEVASGNYFDMLGVRPAQGRVFTPDDDRTPNAHPVVVISDRLVEDAFQRGPADARPAHVSEWESVHDHRHPSGVVHWNGLRERDGFLGAAHDAGASSAKIRMRAVVISVPLRDAKTGKEDCGPGRKRATSECLAD